MPFITFATRACQRPRMLKRNIDSVLAQTDKDFEQIIMVDFERRGVADANKMFGRYAHYIIGDYVYILDDDCMLIEPSFIARLRRFVTENSNPYVVMVRSRRPQFEPRRMPHDSVWGKQEKIRVTTTNALCYIVRSDIWIANAHNFGARSAGDWALLRSLLSYEFKWMDVTVGETQQLGRGVKFEGVSGRGWFNQIINGYGLYKLSDTVYRMNYERFAARQASRIKEKPQKKKVVREEPKQTPLVWITREDPPPQKQEHSLLGRK